MLTLRPVYCTFCTFIVVFNVLTNTHISSGRMDTYFMKTCINCVVWTLNTVYFSTKAMKSKYKRTATINGTYKLPPAQIIYESVVLRLNFQVVVFMRLAKFTMRWKFVVNIILMMVTWKRFLPRVFVLREKYTASLSLSLDNPSINPYINYIGGSNKYFHLFNLRKCA